MRLHMVRFDAAEFQLSRFAAAGLDCPAPIARSVQKRQSEYFHGRLCARSALAEYGHGTFSVGTGNLRQPLWPEGLVGSITHSRAMAACLVLPAARCHGAGIDIEEIPEDCSLFLNGLIFSAGELDYMRSLGPGLPFAAACTIGFSAKESFFKAVSNSVGFYFDFDALRLDAIDPASGRIHFTVQQTLNASWPAGRSCSIHYTLPDAQHVLTLFLA